MSRRSAVLPIQLNHDLLSYFLNGFPFIFPCALQAAYGRKAGTVVGPEIMKDCAKYQDGLVKASQSNVELHKVVSFVTFLWLLS